MAGGLRRAAGQSRPRRTGLQNGQQLAATSSLGHAAELWCGRWSVSWDRLAGWSAMARRAGRARIGEADQLFCCGCSQVQWCCTPACFRARGFARDRYPRASAAAAVAAEPSGRQPGADAVGGGRGRLFIAPGGSPSRLASGVGSSGERRLVGGSPVLAGRNVRRGKFATAARGAAGVAGGAQLAGV